MTTEQRVERSLRDAIQDYLTTLKPDDKAGRQQELRVFARWFGEDRPLVQLSAHQVETYADRIIQSAADPTGRLTPLRDFLSYANKEGWTDDKLASHIKIRKTGTKAAKAAAATRLKEEPIRLTPEGFADKQRELESLKGQRGDIAEALRLARADGDLRENSPLEAERQRQSMVEGRIRELEAEFKRAEVIQGDQIVTSRAVIGSTVTLWDLAHEQQIRYTLVTTNEANIRQMKISVQSPIGKALVDRTVGEVVEVQAPAGLLRYRLESIEGMS